MLALLAPYESYIWAAAALVALAGGLYFTHHEREVGAQAVIAADAKTVAVQQKLNDTVQAAAAVATAISEGVYEKTLATRVTTAPVPDKLCQFSLGSRTVPGPAGTDPSGNGPSGNGTSAVPTAPGLQQFAIGLLQIGSDADAQIDALKADNAALRQEMLNARRK